MGVVGGVQLFLAALHDRHEIRVTCELQLLLQPVDQSLTAD